MLKKRITVISASMGTTRTKLVPHHVTTSVHLEHIRQDMPLGLIAEHVPQLINAVGEVNTIMLHLVPRPVHYVNQENTTQIQTALLLIYVLLVNITQALGCYGAYTVLLVISP